MKISAIKTFALALAVVVNMVSAQITMNKRKPNADKTYDLNTRANMKVKVVPGSAAPDGTTITSVIFHVTNPNGFTFDLTGSKKRNSKYQVKKKLTVVGTWQWSVTATSSAGDERTLPDREFIVVDPSVPTSSPTTSPPSVLSVQQALDNASEEIRTLLDEDLDLGAKFVRLGFHMCVGGCDGCVDMTNQDNRGLDRPIDAIAPIVNKYSGVLSRADLWALATLVAAEEAQPNNRDRVLFPLEYVGRTDCDSADGRSGPAQDLPSPDLTTHDLLTFFSSNFGLSTRETVALMGAHTIGQMQQQNSGFDGQWSNNNRRLDDGYFRGLVGGDRNRPLPSDINILFDAPNWDQVVVNNSDHPDIPDRRVWERTNRNGAVTLMTNSDLALVRDLSNDMVTATGEVSTCRFKGNRTPCPVAAETLRIAAEFKWDIDQWKEEFRDALVKMLGKGYTSGTCSSPPCQLS